MKAKLFFSIGLVIVLVLFSEIQVTITDAKKQVSSKTISLYVTFYGWPDNDPPGNAIAYPKTEGNKTIHNKAGGIGTYDNPITMATDPSELSVGTRVYLPYLKKYAVMEDWCESCVNDWKQKKYHIDIWLESSNNYKKGVIACEETFTREKTAVEIHPAKNRIVDKRPLFDKKTGRCLKAM